MANVSVNEGTFDRSEYEKADQHFRSAEKALPRGAIESIAQEVVRRLAFRMPRSLSHEYTPTTWELDQLCHALLSDDDKAADKVILAARRDGAAMEAIYLGYVAGAARRLGELWNEDRVSFVDVTLASARLYRIIRGLRHVVAHSLIQGRDQRPALFALVPEETHTLGIEIAADLFRREGWEIDMMLGADHDELIDQSESRSYRVIVLVANSNGMLGPLTKLILALRITQPMSHIVLAGNILEEIPEAIDVVGADAVMPDIETAVATLQAIVDDA